MGVHHLTKVALDNLQKEYKHLVHVERVKVIKEIQDARALGDLSENADYDSAKHQQSFVEGRIAEIQDILENYVLIEKKEHSTVDIGSKVRILDMELNEEKDYEILGTVDNNPEMGKISNECPLSQAILGKKVGDVVEVVGINNPYQVKVVNIF